MAKICAPNKAYTGISAGVPFRDGVGETDRPELIEWFKDHGYEVEEAPAFVCPHCGKEYKTEKSLTAHIDKEHPDGAGQQSGETGETGKE